ncbi:MAG: MiaB/RimO family radical SAM methylthiotransferase [Phycisphaerales bacterium]|nr:MiaB/RimO family radical SAM methylthiotransferase [Phycisphaerales bacterium]
MKTFFIQTLGCKVNQYESEQLATLLRARGLTACAQDQADLRIINSCAVTREAVSKSRQLTRRALRLPVLAGAGAHNGGAEADMRAAAEAGTDEKLPTSTKSTFGDTPAVDHSVDADQTTRPRPRVVVTGCWATSDAAAVKAIQGVDAVVGHHDDVAAALGVLLDEWLQPSTGDATSGLDGVAGQNRDLFVSHSEYRPGTMALPVLTQHVADHARAFVKVQDGCDAHCTYCIIPQLRSQLWSKPIDSVVDEVKALVDAGHQEIVLTGIFLGAYGQETALRRRQKTDPSSISPLGELAQALCHKVAGLKRLRFSSLEPMDLTATMVDVLRDLPQVVRHFHLPLQCGSDRLLRRMNRQYRRDDYLRMLDRVYAAFDRPALTTDIICAFPGEDESDFAQTLEVVERARFIHIHAFPFSPRPGTAAARWRDEFVDAAVAADRVSRLQASAQQHSFAFRQQFIGQNVELLVERQSAAMRESGIGHGRCARYFEVHFSADDVRWGQIATVRIDRITRTRTFGVLVGVDQPSIPADGGTII